MAQPQGALLVGSINYDDVETTIRTAVELLGTRLKRIPDGEVGARSQWIWFQGDTIGQAQGIERIGDEPIWFGSIDARLVRVSDGVDPSSIVLPPLGYASAARESYAVFRRLRDEGVIADGVRFQVSLPTPLAVVAKFLPFDQRAGFEPLYRDALFREIGDILSTIPHEDLAFQWDVAVEFQFIEAKGYAGPVTAWWNDVWAGLVARGAEQTAVIPEDVEVGFHFCYGDANEKHFTEPVDSTNLVRFSNALLAASSRRIDWLHFPVPIERDDPAYFTPLAVLELPQETELYLGLVHREDGTKGAARRAAAAAPFVARFGVATECGIGRAPAGTTEDILRTHAEVAGPW